jgi:hypothetical protein
VIDTFSLMVSHGLILIALWRLMSRDDLDRESDDTGTGGGAGDA